MSERQEQIRMSSADDAVQSLEASISSITKAHANIEQDSQQLLAAHQEMGHALAALRARVSIEDAEVSADAKTPVKDTIALTTPQGGPLSDDSPLPRSSEEDKQQNPIPTSISEDKGDSEISELDSILQACDLPTNGTVLVKRQRLITHARFGQFFMRTRSKAGKMSMSV